MSLAGKLPTMQDAALAMLRANAERLLHSGTSAQRTAAAALMPSIEAELETRTAAKLSKKTEALAVRRATKAKAAAVTVD